MISTERLKIETSKSIAFLERCRETHVLWRDWLTMNPEKARAIPERSEEEIAGDLAHHIECIESYDEVLRLLRGSEA